MLHIILILIIQFFHPFFVSVTEVKHNTKDKRVEVSCRMFYDDLEKTLNKTYHKNVDILNPKDKATANLLISDYVKKHVTVDADGKRLNLQYLGYQIEDDACWAYFEVPKVSRIKGLNIRNTLLLTEHSSQSNVMQVALNGKETSVKLDNSNTTASFK